MGPLNLFLKPFSLLGLVQEALPVISPEPPCAWSSLIDFGESEVNVCLYFLHPIPVHELLPSLPFPAFSPKCLCMVV